MDENRIGGAAREFGGKIEDGIGRATGNTKMQGEGLTDQIEGKAQKLYGKAQDAAAATGASARDAGATFGRMIQDTIETQPYLSVGLALGLGWLLGRMHRPL